MAPVSLTVTIVGVEERLAASTRVVLAARVAVVVAGTTVTALTNPVLPALLLWVPLALVVAVTGLLSERGRTEALGPVPVWALDTLAVFGARLLVDPGQVDEPILGMLVVPVMVGALGGLPGVATTVLCASATFAVRTSAATDGSLVAVVIVAVLALTGAGLAAIQAQQLRQARHDAERSRRLQAVLSAVVRHDPRGIVVRDGDGQVVEVNEAACRLLDLAPGNFADFTSGASTIPGDLLDDTGAPLSTPTADRLARMTGDVVSEQTVGVVRDGRTTWLALSAVPVDTASGRWVVTQLRDATEETSTRSRLERQAARDPLTGVGNRRLLEWTMADMRDDAEPVAAVVLDLDQFKALNDEHGHELGDEVLRLVADRLDAASRPDDVVVRLGGDEFLVLLRHVDDDDLAELTDRLRRSLADPYSTSAGLLRVDASVGIASGRAADRRRLLRLADDAMYDRKRARRQRTRTERDPVG